MRVTRTAIALVAAVVFGACGGGTNATALQTAPRATLVQFACIDSNDDHHLNSADVEGDYRPPDFDGDGATDADDAAFFAMSTSRSTRIGSVRRARRAARR